MRAQRDLRVDRGAAADAAAAEQRDDTACAAVDRREAHGPEEVVRRLRLPAREVGGRAVRPELEQEHAAAALRELARDHPAAGAGADDDHVEALAHPMPRYDQSFASRVARGVLKSISAQAPVGVDARGHEIAVEGLDGERPHPLEAGRRGLRRGGRLGERRELGERRRPRGGLHAREQRVDVDGGTDARRPGDDRVAHALDHARGVGIEHLQVGHAAMIRVAQV